MKILALAPFALLAACVSTGDVMARPPITTLKSQKAVADLSSCVAGVFSRSGSAKTIPTTTGVTITQSIPVAGIPSVTFAADIQDIGTERQISFHGVGKPNRNTIRQIEALYGPCL